MRAVETVAAQSPAAARRPPLAILVAISALQPFALNVLAPATPGLARALRTDYATIQLTLTVYLIAVALTQLFVGPISDRVGRRPCILVAVALFVAGSALGALAPNIEMLLVARAVQAAGGGTCFALSRAIVRDTAGRDEAASLIGYITMAMVVSPMIAPLFGGFLDTRFGWRSIFVATGIFGACVGIAASMLLRETAPRGIVSSPMDMLRSFPVLIRDRRFFGFTLAMSATTGGFFGFIAGAPYLVVDVMGRSPNVYALYFILSAGSYMAGNFVTGRFGMRIGSARLVLWGTLLSLASVSIGLGFALLGPWNPATLFLPLTLHGAGNGLIIPGATAAALSTRPDLAGTAAGLVGASQLGLGALSAVIVGASVMIWPPSLMIVMLACALLSLGGYLVAAGAKDG